MMPTQLPDNETAIQEIESIADNVLKESMSSQDVLVEVKSKIWEIEKLVDKIPPHMLQAATLLSDIKTKVRKRWGLEERKSKEDDRKSGSGAIAPALILILGGWAVSVASILNGGTMVKAEKTHLQAPLIQSNSDLLHDGHTLLQEGKYELAIKKYEESLKTGGCKEQCLLGMAECYYSLNEDEKCILTSVQLIHHNPDCARIHTIRGLVFKRQNNINKAKYEFDLGSKLGDPIATKHLKRI